MALTNRRAFITGIKSTYLSKKEIYFLKKYKPWGVIIFSRNIKTINQVKKLTKNIRNIFKDSKYPILIDEEGGRVSRLQKIYDTSIYTGSYFGALFLNNKKKFLSTYKKFINETSFMLKKIGVNINTVPVLDLKKKGSSSIIGNRAYSEDPKINSIIGNFCIKHFQNKKIGTVIKHIPGHGSAKVDSHKFTPKVNLKLSYLIKNDFFPFKKKLSYFAMTGHIIFSNIDNKNTVTHSKKVIRYIRKKIKFNNLLLSDDISMKSLKSSISINTIKAFEAGCNIVLHCNGNYKEMLHVAKNSPIIDKFIVKKTSQFYNILR